MSRLVMKFGGTSVANIERIRNVARHVKREVDAGHEVANTFDIGDGRAAEFHHEAAHDDACIPS